MRRSGLIAIGLAAWTATVAASAPVAAEGDPDDGARVFFRACGACHSLEPGEHLTGPSLAGLWGREAGAVGSFTRYSAALQAADLVWNAETLDPWLEDPQRFIPGNLMTFPGIKDPRPRADLIAYLQAVTAAEEDAAPRAGDADGGMGGGGMMGSLRLVDLKAVGPGGRVTAIRYCGDTYHVTTAAGATIPFWEFNLRFKTDGSDLGPPEGEPALLPAGMMGDRASVVFAKPEEISAFIQRRC